MIKIIEKIDIRELSKSLAERRLKDSQEISKTVSAIIENVKKDGDKALIQYTTKFDKVELEKLEVTEDEIEEALNEVDQELIDIIKESKKNIEAYHKLQKRKDFIFTKENGVFMGQRVIPLDKIGVYVPGGKAAYPSSVLMNVIPAKVAGVREIIMTTPPNSKGMIDKNILVAAKIAGVDRIFKIGGAQGIAALAYGTETIPSVAKIVGPGNAFVAECKRQVYGQVGIDMMAGPSEIMVVADDSSNPSYIAADLMSQAEHDEKASSVLLTTSKVLAEKVKEEINKQIIDLEKKEIIIKSLNDYGNIIICNSIDEAIDIVNFVAPEHLELLIHDPMEYLNKIQNAASVFIGQYTPEPVGDYFGGTNHVLPTGGSARFSSPLSVDDFIKKSSFLHYSKEALESASEKIQKFAKAEGLTAHSNSVKVRSKR